MREILFRGKRVSDGQWVTGSYIRANMHWHKNGIHEDWISPMVFANGGYMNVAQRYAVKGDTVGQFTGKIDRNGVKVFEGDVLAIDTDSGDDDGERFAVKMYDYEWITDSGVFDYPISCLDTKHIEVVGNIHDNPELVGGDC